MKKVFALVMLLAFGMLLGCGEEKKPGPKGGSGSTAPVMSGSAK